jgi:opacity protein-like surface antigen
MKNLLLAAIAAVSLTAAIAPAANAAWGEPQSSLTQHHGPYDDTNAGSHLQYGGGDGAG